MPVKSISNTDEFNKLINGEDASRLIIVDFTAKWCGPCKVISPIFETLSNKYPHCRFLKVDVDDAQAVAAQEEVSAMPTFKFFKGGKVIHQIQGADPSSLTTSIEKHQGPNDDLAAKFGVSNHSDITHLLTGGQISSLNLKPENDIKCIFKKDNEIEVETDTDAQLIISVNFTQAIKLHTIKFVAPLAHAPKSVKLFANYSTLGFDDAEAVTPTQELELSEADYAESAVTNLRFVKFQNVTSLSIFIEDNLEDDDVTKIQKLIFIGTPVQSVNMKEFNKGNE